MDRRKLLLFGLSFAFGIVGWALSVIVSPLWWLPYIALPIAGTAMLVFGGLLWRDHLNATRRKSLPGFGVHLGIRVSDIREQRRQYIFDLGAPGGPGAAFYLSASRRFVFLIRDARGEPYSMDIPAGWLGFPLADPAYFGLEAGTDGITTIMRAVVNGRILLERTLPFPVDFTGLGVDDLTIGANRDATHHGGFGLYLLAMYSCTMTDEDAKQIARYVASKTGAPVEA